MKQRVMQELAPRLHALVKLARDSGIGLTVDAEEAERLELSLLLIDSVLVSDVLDGYAGFGLAVLPSFIADRDPDLVRCLPPLEGDPAALWLLTHERLRHTPRVRVVMDFVGDRLMRVARETRGEHET